MKTFTQDEVNGLLARDRKTHQARAADLEAQLAARTAELAAITSERDALTRTAELVRAERDKVQAAHDEFRASVRSRNAEQTILDALVAAKVLRSAEKAALVSFLSASKIEQSDDGKITAIEYGGTRHADVISAANAFLKDHDYLAAAPGVTGAGGAGSKPQNCAPPAPEIDLSKADPARLVQTGWNQPQRR